MDETFKKYLMDVRKSEWSGSDDGKDNITFLEREAILRPCLVHGGNLVNITIQEE